jgi:hypothetical protein
MICDRALLGAYAQGKDRVDTPMLSRAAREVFGETKVQVPLKRFRWVLASLLLIGCYTASAQKAFTVAISASGGVAAECRRISSVACSLAVKKDKGSCTLSSCAAG